MSTYTCVLSMFSFSISCIASKHVLIVINSDFSVFGGKYMRFCTFSTEV